MSTILILANHYNTLRIFRRELLQKLCELGHQVLVALPPCDEENQGILERYGCEVLWTPELDRRGLNPWHDLKLLCRYRRLIRENHPDQVIAYTIKPNIYGGIACRLTGTLFSANVTGLGSTFQKEGLMKKLVSSLYKLALSRAQHVFFENQGNLKSLVVAGIVSPSQAVLMPGAGVNLQEFAPAPYPSDVEGTRFLFVGRIMQEKGVDELFTAIRRVKSVCPDSHFDFIGWYEDSYQSQVEEMQQNGLITYHGFCPEVRPYMEGAHCVILPSWHEGMSNTLLEGAAMARPLITNRIHGCMEAVIDRESGLLVTKKDTDDLTEKILAFVDLPWERKRDMGLKGRELMESVFDKKIVVKRTLQVLNLT